MGEKSKADSPRAKDGDVSSDQEVVASCEKTLHEFARVLGQLVARRWLKQQAGCCESVEPPCGTGS